MRPTLADTSIWVDYLRHGSATARGESLHQTLVAGSLLTCGPVVAELIAGTGDRDRERLSATLLALDWIEFGRRRWLAVGELASKLRRGGETVALTDVEIAAAALAAGAELLTADRDFERIERVEPRLSIRVVE